MKVRALAGTRRLVEPAPAAPIQPQYRWTFRTWVRKSWRVRDYSRHSAGYVDRDCILSERAVTVTAATEAEAKQKIEAAIPSTPANEKGYTDNDTVIYEREWSIVGNVEEVH